MCGAFIVSTRRAIFEVANFGHDSAPLDSNAMVLQMAAPELPHLDFVSLHQGLGSCFLLHRGTGELVDICGHRELEFSHDGFAILYDAGDGSATPKSEWASAFFTRSLHSSRRVVDGNDEEFINGFGDCSATVWRADLLAKPRKTKIFSGTCENMWLDTYHPELPSERSFVRWSIPGLVTCVFGPHYKGDWICRRIRSWKTYLHKIGLPNNSVHPSANSVREKARQAGKLPRDAEMADADEHYSVSTAGLAYIAMWFASATGVKAQPGWDLRAKASQFLSDVFSKISPATPIDVFLEGIGFHVQVANGRVMASLDTSDQEAEARALFGSCNVSLGSAMLSLMDNARRGAPSRREQVGNCLFDLVQRLAVEVDARSSDASIFVDPADVEQITLRRDSSKRVRRIPMSYKLGACAAFAEEPKVKDAAQFLAVSLCASRRRRGGAKKASRPSDQPKATSAAKWVVDTQLAYQASCVRLFNRSTPMYFSTDGVRAGTRDYRLTAFGCPRQDLHCWGPRRQAWAAQGFWILCTLPLACEKTNPA